MKDDRAYAEYILDCIAAVESFLGGRGSERFHVERVVRDACLRNLQTMAESTQRFSEAVKQTHSQLPWRKIAGFRNLLVHDYFGIDPDEVWKVIEIELPKLKLAVQEILETLPGAT